MVIEFLVNRESLVNTFPTRLALALALAAGTVMPCHAGTIWTNYDMTSVAGASTTWLTSLSVSGNTIAVGTYWGGVCISTNGGATWTTKTSQDGLPGDDVRGV